MSLQTSCSQGCVLGGGFQNLHLELWPQMTSQAKVQPFGVSDMAHWQRLCLESITGSAKGAQVHSVFECLTLEVGESFPHNLSQIDHASAERPNSAWALYPVSNLYPASPRLYGRPRYLPTYPTSCALFFPSGKGLSISSPVHPVSASIALFLLLPTVAFTIQWTEQAEC